MNKSPPVLVTIKIVQQTENISSISYGLVFLIKKLKITKENKYTEILSFLFLNPSHKIASFADNKRSINHLILWRLCQSPKMAHAREIYSFMPACRFFVKKNRIFFFIITDNLSFH